MANDCFYRCKIVGKTEESVQQIVDALKYKDFKRGYHMFRIFEADETRKTHRVGKFYSSMVKGYCAWSVHLCMIESSYGVWKGADIGEPKFSVWRDWSGICYANLFMTMPMLCKELKCGVEIWSEEPGMGFQEHYHVNHNGEVVENESVDWNIGYDEDENGEYIRENHDKDTGGFENYGEFMNPMEVFG